MSFHTHTYICVCECVIVCVPMWMHTHVRVFHPTIYPCLADLPARDHVISGHPLLLEPLCLPLCVCLCGCMCLCAFAKTHTHTHTQAFIVAACQCMLVLMYLPPFLLGGERSGKHSPWKGRCQHREIQFLCGTRPIGFVDADAG